jgi:UDP-N-acetylglucosamine/UDP-N-acetylgalactosamine diphosphorylase
MMVCGLTFDLPGWEEPAMVKAPEEIRQRLRHYGQEHVLAHWHELSNGERQQLVAQIQALDLEQLRRLHARRDHPYPVPSQQAITPVSALRLDARDTQTRSLGEEALGRGEVAALVVAGGQGTRLGFDHPKGLFPIGPVSGKSLFQLHAEKVLALGRRFGRALPLLVMTSPATHAETEEFFQKHSYFGLLPEDVWLFCQGTMPALDLTTGRLLMEAPSRLFLSPNGHGGVLLGLRDSGCLERLRSRGVRTLFYFQVDNPLVKVADPHFLGHHLAQHAEVSSKVVPKQTPTDKLGNLVLIDGRCAIIEYSDLPQELAQATDEQGWLRFSAGSPAIHIFDVEFLARLTEGELGIPFHVARKKVPHLDEAGKLVQPDQENALKFEMFIFDVLPRAERWTVVETTRREEFEPLKNATGADSAETVRQALSNLAADLLEQAGLRVPRRADGNAAVALEISPRFALDAAELAARVDRRLRIDGPTYLEG